MLIYVSININLGNMCDFDIIKSVELLIKLIGVMF